MITRIAKAGPLAILVLLLGVGCKQTMGALFSWGESSGSAGRIVGARADASFVSRPEMLYALTRRGLVRLPTRGGEPQLLVAGATDAIVSPTGGRILVRTKRALSVVALHEGSVQELPCCESAPTRWGWNETGDEVWIELSAAGGGQAPLPPAEMRRFPIGALASSPRPVCAIEPTPSSRDACGGLELGEQPLVEIVGCEKGHWWSPSIPEQQLSRDCSNLVFEFDRGVYVVELATHKIAHLVAGKLIALDR